MVSIKEIKDGFFSYEEVDKGWVVKIRSAFDLVKAAEKVRDAGIKRFDCFSPFPIHGLEKAMGLSRSWITLVTLIAGLGGATAAMSLMVYIMVIDWPLNIGGKPHFSWPAFIPITFELTVLFAGLATVASVIVLGKLGRVNRKAIMRGTMSDSFAIWIGDDVDKNRVEGILGELVEEIREVEK